MIQRDANAFGESVGAFEIRHFTSEMRPSCGCGRLLSQQLFQRHAKLIFFRERLLSLHLRFNGARNCSGEKVLSCRDCIYPTLKRPVIIIESISAKFAPRVSSRDAQRVYKPQFTRLVVIKAKFRRRAPFIRLSARFLSPAPHMQIRARWICRRMDRRVSSA